VQNRKVLGDRKHLILLYHKLTLQNAQLGLDTSSTEAHLLSFRFTYLKFARQVLFPPRAPMRYSPAMERPGRTFGIGNIGLAWLLFSIAFAVHTCDEAVHDFSGYYNSTVLALYGHFSWFPRIDLTFHAWLTTLVVANLLVLALTPYAFRGVAWLRPLAYILAVIGMASSVGHILATIRGKTVPSVLFESVSPGFYTSPFVLLSSAYLLWSCFSTCRPDVPTSN
jgi:hypothetical protein